MCGTSALKYRQGLVRLQNLDVTTTITQAISVTHGTSVEPGWLQSVNIEIGPNARPVGDRQVSAETQRQVREYQMRTGAYRENRAHNAAARGGKVRGEGSGKVHGIILHCLN